jgi:FAD/FMN-containing dehydrogenase
MPVDRRAFLQAAGSLALAPARPLAQTAEPGGVLVNDIHSRLNATRVRQIVSIDSVDALGRTVAAAAREGQAVCIAGGRHAMGAQQFGAGAIMLDMRALNRIRRLDQDRGLVDVEAGAMWPELINGLLERQAGSARQWGIAQKQTGADRLTLGGALAANVHGRGLRMRPIVGDVESFVLVDAAGNPRACSRSENAELFRLAIGGYGLVGVIASVQLRLVPRQKVRRVVEVRRVDELPAAFEQRIADGFLYGDFQFSIDEKSEDFLQRGVFSCYQPVAADTPIRADQRELVDEDWHALLLLAHADKARAFEQYAGYYLSTNGQVYWSDTHQLSTYLDGYHLRIDARAGGPPATEMITEIYVQRAQLPEFMRDVAAAFRVNGVPIVYGTVRLIERDDESVLAWATDRYACIIFNLHVIHSPDGTARAADAFRTLIDLGLKRGGRYYLTYHRYARRDQVDACYPQLAEFLRLKRRYDPEERFQSEWYRHYKAMLA